MSHHSRERGDLTHSFPIDPKRLRQQGEARLLEQQSASQTSSPFLSPQATVQLLHDLKVHQIELELQNEELRNAQFQLDTERARYFDLYDLAPIGYCTLSEQGLILEANLTAANLLGEARGALIGKAFSRFILREDQDVYYLHRKKLFDAGSTQSCELRMLTHSGDSFWAHLEASIARNADGEALHRLVLTDISVRKILDQALQEKNIELEVARKAADKANSAKSDFLSNMSHELRSPLNSILGFAQLLDTSTPAPSDAQKARIAHILQAGWYLLDLINEILDLALIESGKLSFSLAAVSLPALLADCRVMIEPLAEQTGVQVSLGAFDSNCVVSADRTRLTQVLVNLLSNAVKYNRVNGTVEVSAQAITPQRLRISVRDTGQGLSETKLTQLFQPFNRLGQEASAIAGTGIGLMVCKRLIEMMGGAIGAESTVGVGSVFWIELNMTAMFPSTVLADDTPSQLAPAPPLDDRQRTVLYVEDNPANMELVAQIIASRPDLRLIGAHDGAQGITLATTELPDVILLDVHLPGMNGLQVLQALRRDRSTREIPVLALTANAMPRDIETGLAAGFLRYLTKPIKNKELLQALDLALESAQAQQPDDKGTEDFL
jgi:PAS domain S-box-containing protein